MRWGPDLKKLLTRQAQTFAGILIFAVIMSFFSRWHWMTDIFSHFVLQYLIGAVILGAAFAALRQWKMLAVMIAIALFSYTVSRPQYYNPSYRYMATAYAPAGQIKILQYNRLVQNNSHEEVKELLINTSADVVVLQEANPSLSEMTLTLKDIYPYQIQEPRTHAFGMIVLSKFPLEQIELSPMDGQPYMNFVLRFAVIHPNTKKPVIIYALHAIPPLGYDAWKQRNYELSYVAKRIEADNNPFIIFTGDLNITPYSPFFRDLLSASKMFDEYNGSWNLNTWPTGHMLPVLQIPIDHMLHSGGLALSERKILPALGSDHYPTLATFWLLLH
ncbi:MAG: endonuclease/exonuclease/phosphatase family protein [Micavibrio sp.]